MGHLKKSVASITSSSKVNQKKIDQILRFLSGHIFVQTSSWKTLDPNLSDTKPNSPPTRLFISPPESRLLLTVRLHVFRGAMFPQLDFTLLWLQIGKIDWMEGFPKSPFPLVINHILVSQSLISDQTAFNELFRPLHIDTLWQWWRGFMALSCLFSFSSLA